MWRTLLHCWWKCKLIQTLWRKYGDSKKKKKTLIINLAYHQAILLLHIYLEKTTIQKDTCAPVFISALFTRARTWNQPRCPSTDEWMKRIGILLSHQFSSVQFSHLVMSSSLQPHESQHAAGVLPQWIQGNLKGRRSRQGKTYLFRNIKERLGKNSIVGNLVEKRC